MPSTRYRDPGHFGLDMSSVVTMYLSSVLTSDIFYPQRILTICSSKSTQKFQICHCPALLHKPPLPTPHFETMPKKKPSDPFAPPYVEGLLVGSLLGEDDEEYIVLVRHIILLLRMRRSTRH